MSGSPSCSTKDRTADRADSYCLKEGYGTRLIPHGTITAAHFVRVKSDKVSYVQVTGSGDVSPPTHSTLFRSISGNEG